MRLTLLRTENTTDGVFGRLNLPGMQSLFTCEDDWRNNQKGQSCIPAGLYLLKRTVYHKHGYEAFWVSNVPGRDRILIHPGNTEEDVEGCILVGLRQGKLWVPDEDTPTHRMTEKRAVVASREAFRRLMNKMAGVDEAELLIEWAPGLP